MIIFNCNRCEWSGTEGELVSITVDPEDRTFEYCPRCNGNDFEILNEAEDIPDMRR